MPRGTRSGRNLDSAREKMLEGTKGICFLETRRAMHCCQFWAVISRRVRSMRRRGLYRGNCAGIGKFLVWEWSRFLFYEGGLQCAGGIGLSPNAAEPWG